MIKYKYYEELDAATFDNSRLPLKNCVFGYANDKWNSDSLKGTLTHIGYYDEVGALCFKKRFDKSTAYTKCAQVISRYPRDVPEGVAELPEDKPQLAYVGELKSDQFDDSSIGSLYFLGTQRCIKLVDYGDTGYTYKIAIDVSTPWAQENFPDIVEAMEYEAIYEYHKCVTENPEDYKTLIGHKLGNKTYDLEWKEATLPRCGEVVKGKIQEKEPPDIEQILEDHYGDSPVQSQDYLAKELIARHAKARGRWEAINYAQASFKSLHDWKYETVEDYFNDKGFKMPDVCKNELIIQAFNAAREMHGCPDIPVLRTEGDNA